MGPYNFLQKVPAMCAIFPLLQLPRDTFEYIGAVWCRVTPFCLYWCLWLRRVWFCFGLHCEFPYSSSLWRLFHGRFMPWFLFLAECGGLLSRGLPVSEVQQQPDVCLCILMLCLSIETPPCFFQSQHQMQKFSSHLMNIVVVLVPAVFSVFYMTPCIRSSLSHHGNLIYTYLSLEVCTCSFYKYWQTWRSVVIKDCPRVKKTTNHPHPSVP